MPDFDLIAEARRRLRTSAPQLTDAQWLAWLASVATRGGRVTLTLDGAVAVYDLARSPQGNVARATDQIE